MEAAFEISPLEGMDDEQAKKPSRASRGGKRVKRKWREIEALQERRRLLKELQEIDPNFDGDLDELL